MRSRLYFSNFLLMTVSLASPALWASTPPSVSGIEVVTGKKTMSDLSQAKLGTVVVFLSAKCPCSASHEVELKSLYEAYSNKGFQFVGVHSNHDENLEFSRAHFKDSSLPFPIVEDVSNQIADAFGALKTPHVFIIGKNREVLYQGGVDDSNNHANAKTFYLRNTLAALLEGKEAPLKETRTLGCVIQR